MSVAKRLTVLLPAALTAFGLTACGGGGDSPNVMPSPVATFGQVAAVRDRYDPDASNAGADGDVNKLGAYSPERPTRVFVPVSETLRVGSLVRDGYNIVLRSQLQGRLFEFNLYGPQGALVADFIRSSMTCTGGTCPAPEALDPIHEETYRVLRQQGRLSDDPSEPAFSRSTVTPEEFMAVYRRVAAGMGYTGTFTLRSVNFSDYQVPTPDEAVGRAVDLIDADRTRVAQGIWDVGLLGEATGLEYTDFGIWAYRSGEGGGDCTAAATLCLIGLHVFGAETPVDQIPASGSATYTGTTVGFVGPRGGAFSTDDTYALGGTLEVGVDFATGSVTAEASGMELTRGTERPSQRWYDFTFTGRLDADDRSRYTASEVVVTAPGSEVRSEGDVGTSPTGGLEGVLYGPSGAGGPRETGGTWHLSDDDTVAVGSFGAKR